MINWPPSVTIKTITDYHLESFIECPYKFYYQHLLLLNPSQMKWRQVTQIIINQVVQNFYQLPLGEQTKLNALKLIQRYWENVNSELFESKIQYYTVLAKTTDYLLQFLVKKKKIDPPLFLYQKLNTYIEELETQLSLTFEFAEWTVNSFTIKKFLVEADEEMIQLYNYLMAVFSKEAFGKLPETIEIVTLLDGKKYTFSPKMSDVAEGIMYLNNMKNLLQNPNNYTKTISLTECRGCPYLKKCEGSQNQTKKNIRKREDLLH